MLTPADAICVHCGHKRVWHNSEFASDGKWFCGHYAIGSQTGACFCTEFSTKSIQEQALQLLVEAE